MNNLLEGAVPVIPIPFTNSFAIDETTLRRTVEFACTRGMKAFCLPAYGSEFYKLSDDERERVVRIAIDQSAGRVYVVAQANHPSAEIAGDLARRYEQCGADVISIALPRQFPTTDRDLMEYCGRVAESVRCPLLIQDFNPGGPTIGAEFIKALSDKHSNACYFKLEEPMIVDKLMDIEQKVGGRVGILGGWGAYFMLESIPAGICGIMPGVSICDLLNRVFHEGRNGNKQCAYDLFIQVFPLIAFSLQNFEMFLQIEKRLLVRRGVFANTVCRPLTRTLSQAVSDHIDFLLDQVMSVLRQEEFESTNRIEVNC